MFKLQYAIFVHFNANTKLSGYNLCDICFSCYFTFINYTLNADMIFFQILLIIMILRIVVIIMTKIIVVEAEEIGEVFVVKAHINT